ncbi:GNAT family N-acetyltransferase [Helcobacillus massiliensis]|uniref:GNAT family N-acetyltransferase n=1 Tax=Helcobacillus massiliensis TaxID=521392 RepID=UPI0021A62DB0|nr:GNAT family N-acetyltransferase [Helcobacillus massiliensis]MCT1558016.1 GNAT family N-acetyltransferase [Helcobacillus massiliensis]MCT2036734.1 GNAT family N-acetyltransferase [Helcobacillus massiliensis]MCT2330792.1 GNAT family N-acetyltransferase [Helcobacillus massiliensis]
MPQWIAQRSRPVPDDVRRIIATLPEWFGLPDANQEYIDAAETKETWTVRADGAVIGVALIDRHFEHVAEVHFMAVDREYLGCGVGTALMAAIEADARERGVALLEVKTLGASHPDKGYAKTRRFYEKVGFLPLEETDLWGEDNPCLFMVKPLVASAR